MHQHMDLQRTRRLWLSGGAAVCLGFHTWAQGLDRFLPTGLVSDLPGLAVHQDANLIDPWGLTSSATGPFWIANTGTGVSTVYDGGGVTVPLVVTVPPPSGGTPPGRPTGATFNGSSNFELSAGAPARFLFASAQGTISGWNPATDPTHALLKVDHSSDGAIYRGLAVGNNGSGDFLYAANFHSGSIEVFDSQFNSTTLPGNFVDPNLPAGFAPSDLQNIGGVLYVAYAKQAGIGDGEATGPGAGFVDRFDLNGSLLGRVVSQGQLNAPSGMAMAPDGFGPFGGALLVGNFGDGRINAFDPATGAFLGSLEDMAGEAIAIAGLRDIAFGNGAAAGDTHDLYYTAGTGNEEHGNFGKIALVPEPVTGAPVVFGAAALALAVSARRRPTKDALDMDTNAGPKRDQSPARSRA